MTNAQYEKLDLALGFAETALEDGDVVTAAGALAKARAVLDDIEPTEEKPVAAPPDDDDADAWHEGMSKEEEALWSARQHNAVATQRRAFEAAELNARLAARGGRTL